MLITDLTLDHALSVCRRMRQMDRECLDAALGVGVEADAFAVDRWQSSGPAWAGLVDGCPEVIFGLNLTTGWACTAWLVATDNMRPQTWRKLLRFAGTVRQNVLAPGFQFHRHRIEAHVLADWPGAQELARHLGMQYEGTRRAAGSGGQSIEIYAAVTP